ncbi:DUF2062 domain-containing protein [Planctomycetota bacterium]
MVINKHIQTATERFVNFVKRHVLHADDSAHRLALGAALGLFVAWTPFLGLHILIVLGLALVLRANKFLALICVWVCNAFTLVAIYYPSYLLGQTVLSFFRTEPYLGPNKIAELFKESLSLKHIHTNFLTSQFWEQLGIFIVQIGLELLIGGLIIGSVVATIAYFTIRRLIISYRKKHMQPICSY